MTPWTQPELLKVWFKPIKNRVETHYGGVTLLKSASNLKQFIKKPIIGEYDVVQVPVQIGMYLMDIYNFKPVMIVHGRGIIILRCCWIA